MNNSHSSLRSITRQTRPKLIAFFVTLLFALIIIFTSRTLEGNLNYQLSHQALPQLNQGLTKLTQLNNYLEAINQIAERDQLPNIDKHHADLVASIASAETLTAELNALTSFSELELQRLADNIARNQALLTNAQTQVVQALDLVNERQASDLARQLPWLINVGQILNALNHQLADVQREVIPANIEPTKQLISALVLVNNNIVDQDPELSAQLTQVADTFLEGDTLLGKWQGSARLFEQYQAVLLPAHSALIALRQQLTEQIQTHQQSSVEANVINIAGHWFDLSRAVLVLNILAGVLLIIAGLCTYLIYRSFAENLHELIEFASNQLAGKESENERLNAEQAYLQEAISTSFNSAYSQAEVEQLHKEHAMRWQRLAQMVNGHVWWIEDGCVAVSAIGELNQFLSLKEQAKNYQSIQHWKSLIGHQSLRLLIQAARKAKSVRQIECVSLECHDKTLMVYIGYENSQWFGCVVDARQEAALSGQVSQLQHQLTEQNQQALMTSEHDFETLSQLVVQAMLQSQNTAVVSGANNQPIYRQLERIFNWLRQQQILAQLGLTQREKQFVDINTRQTIYASIYNLANDAGLRQNQIHLMLDDNLAQSIKVDNRLFVRLINGFSRLLLKELFKHQLVLKFDVIDQDTGKQVVAISGKVTSVGKKQPLPKHIARIESGKLSGLSSRAEQYFIALLSAMHGEQLNVKQIDDGFELNFKLPLTLSSKQKSPLADTRLMQRNVLVVSSCKAKAQILAHYLKSAKAECDTLGKSSYFAKNFSLEAISRKKLDAVVVASDKNDDIVQIQQHIDSLPIAKRPVLFVMQSPQANLQTSGLFSMTDLPICQQRFVNELAAQLEHKQANNRLIDAQHFAGMHFMPAQVEVLLAVSDVEQYQALWRILMWFGFKVTVVTDGNAMLKHWRTGRYLVLMNEFSHSPFVGLMAGKSISRGVFSFADDEVIELTEEQAEIGKHWHFGKVPNFDELEVLTQLLAPWLKESVQFKQVSAPPVSESRYTNAQAPLSFSQQLSDSLPPAFDMEQYAKNQGSPELAVFMLDDYIDTLVSATSQLSEWINEKNHQAIQSAINEITLTASILAAPALLQLGSQLEQAFINNSYDHMHRLVEQVKQEILIVKSFSEAI